VAPWRAGQLVASGTTDPSPPHEGPPHLAGPSNFLWRSMHPFHAPDKHYGRNFYIVTTKYVDFHASVSGSPLTTTNMPVQSGRLVLGSRLDATWRRLGTLAPELGARGARDPAPFLRLRAGPALRALHGDAPELSSNEVVERRSRSERRRAMRRFSEPTECRCRDASSNRWPCGRKPCSRIGPLRLERRDQRGVLPSKSSERRSDYGYVVTLQPFDVTPCERPSVLVRSKMSS
jgi:hypothetical protein